MSEIERDELEALAEVQDAAADEVIAEADADLADLALDAAAVVEEDRELAEAIEDAAEETSSVAEMQEEGSPVSEDPYKEFRAELRTKPGKWYVLHSYASRVAKAFTRSRFQWRTRSRLRTASASL